MFCVNNENKQKHVSDHCDLCSQRYGLWDHEGPLEEKSKSSSEDKSQDKTEESIFQLSEEEDSQTQAEPQTEVLSITASVETPTDGEIKSDPEPNFSPPAITDTPDTATEDGQKKRSFLRFRKTKQTKKGQRMWKWLFGNEGWNVVWLAGNSKI